MTVTETSKANLIPFKPGTDKRRNLKGHNVNGFDQLRKEWQKIWNEIMLDDKGQPIIDAETGKQLTRIKARMRIATSSRNHQEFRTALEYAYGKVKEEVDVTSAGNALVVQIVKASDDTDANKD
jgi:hypothetical protein